MKDSHFTGINSRRQCEREKKQQFDPLACGKTFKMMNLKDARRKETKTIEICLCVCFEFHKANFF